MKLIKKKQLLQCGFAHNEAESNEEYTVFDNREFRVMLKIGDRENSLIGIMNPVLSGFEGNGMMLFPGAYTFKDLLDIIFFYLGDEQMTKFRKDWTLPEIVKITKPKSIE